MLQSCTGKCRPYTHQHIFTRVYQLLDSFMSLYKRSIALCDDLIELHNQWLECLGRIFDELQKYFNFQLEKRENNILQSMTFGYLEYNTPDYLTTSKLLDTNIDSRLLNNMNVNSMHNALENDLLKITDILSRYRVYMYRIYEIFSNLNRQLNITEILNKIEELYTRMMNDSFFVRNYIIPSCEKLAYSNKIEKSSATHLLELLLSRFECDQVNELDRIKTFHKNQCIRDMEQWK